MTRFYSKFVFITVATVLSFAALNALAGRMALAASYSFSQRFLNPNPDPGDAFGSELAISKDKVLIGARFDSTKGNSSGGAYLFDADGGKLTQTFSHPNLNTGDTFGTAVAIAGNRVLIGASGEGNFGSNGAAFLFDAVSGNLIQRFFTPNSTVFGSSVAISEEKVIIGDIQNRTLANISGAAFQFDAVNGNLTQSFFPPNPDTEDFFSSSIAIDGDRVLIGASGGGLGRNKSGAAFLFDAVNGDLNQTFLNPNPDAEDFFGGSVAISGDKVLISALRDDTIGSNSGAAYLFDAVSGKLIQSFFAPNPNDGEVFGGSIAIDGDKVLIGARGDDTFGSDSGAAFLFDAVSGNLTQSFFAPNPSADGNFGFSVAIDGDNLLIGAVGDDEGGIDSGTVFLFQPKAVPEPSTSLGTVLFLGLGALLRKQKKHQKLE